MIVEIAGAPKAHRLPPAADGPKLPKRRGFPDLYRDSPTAAGCASLEVSNLSCALGYTLVSPELAFSGGVFDGSIGNPLAKSSHPLHSGTVVEETQPDPAPQARPNSE